MIEFYDYGRGVVPTRKTAGLPLLFCVISRSVSRPAEVRPWEVRFAHPCRARARHPIHKAMGGHASHGRTSDRAFVRLGWSVSPNTYRRRQKKRPKNTPRPLNNVRAKGLEPIRTKAPDPKSGLATNYNTLANPFRKTHNIKPIAEYDLVGSCRILCPKRNAKIVKDFQFSKPVRIFVKNTEKKYDICASKKTNRKNCGPELETKTG